MSENKNPQLNKQNNDIITNIVIKSALESLQNTIEVGTKNQTKKLPLNQ